VPIANCTRHRPTRRPVDEVIAAFNNLTQPLSNNSQLNDFLSTYFLPAHGDLDEVPTDELNTDPTFLDKISDTVIKEFSQKVIDIWPDLTRRYAGAGNCAQCATSFIPVNRTFVVVRSSSSRAQSTQGHFDTVKINS
jgi:alpha,alpha-trehalase